MGNFFILKILGNQEKKAGIAAFLLFACFKAFFLDFYLPQSPGFPAQES